MKKVIIDTDPGIDDAAALLLALASPELSIVAITTIYGNAPVEVTTQNAYKILYSASRIDIPIYLGASKPLLRDPNTGWALHVHGDDALGNTYLPVPDVSDIKQPHHAAIEIINRVMAEPGEITLIALGRLTNIALALSIEPKLVQSVAEIIVMGGAIHVAGNVSRFATANLHEDPESASIVYQSGAPIVQVGLDVCNDVEIPPDQFSKIRSKPTASTQLLTAATPVLQSYYHNHNLLKSNQAVRFNDMPAVAYAINPTFFTSSRHAVTIEIHDEESRGQTRLVTSSTTPKNKCVEVCLTVDVDRLTRFFTTRVSQYTVIDKQGLG